MEREEFINILARLQEKDIKALEKLYNEYFDRIYSIALYEVKNRDDAYDLAMGRTDDLAAISINSAKAAVALEMTVQVASRAVTAYKEILQMQI